MPATERERIAYSSLLWRLGTVRDSPKAMLARLIRNRLGLAIWLDLTPYTTLATTLSLYSVKRCIL